MYVDRVVIWLKHVAGPATEIWTWTTLRRWKADAWMEGRTRFESPHSNLTLNLPPAPITKWTISKRLLLAKVITCESIQMFVRTEWIRDLCDCVHRKTSFRSLNVLSLLMSCIMFLLKMCEHVLWHDPVSSSYFIFFYVWISVHHKSILYKEPTRCYCGSIVY